MTVLKENAEGAVVLVTPELYHNDYRFFESPPSTNPSIPFSCLISAPQ